MARRCGITGKTRQVGNRVSHANNKHSRSFQVNLRPHRIFVPELGRFVKMKISNDVLRTIDKCGISETLKMYGMSVKSLA